MPLIAARSLLVCACVLAACSEGANASPHEEAGIEPWQPVTDTEAGAAAAAESMDGALLAVDSGAAAPRLERVPLVVHNLWRRVEPPADPFGDRPALTSCSAAATMVEMLAGESAFSIDTGSCNYLTAMQPTLLDVAEGEHIGVRLWHFELSASEPAEAHVAVVIDGLPLLDERVAIPHAGGLISKRVAAVRAIPAGAPAYLHLHNHGANSWSLIEISSGP